MLTFWQGNREQYISLESKKTILVFCITAWNAL